MAAGQQPAGTKTDSMSWKAIGYTLNQRDLLIGYVQGEHLHINNAAAEKAFRPFAAGRCNWIFVDTPSGTGASAACWSLIDTAKTRELEPHDCLQHVLERIAETDMLEKLEGLLSWNVNSAAARGDRKSLFAPAPQFIRRLAAIVSKLGFFLCTLRSQRRRFGLRDTLPPRYILDQKFPLKQ